MESQEKPQKQRFFSKVSGSKFIMADGHEILFMHGFFDFDPANYPGPILLNSFNNQKDARDGQPKAKVYYDELMGLIRVGNPLIYIQGTQPEALPKPKDFRGREGADQNALSEVEIAQQEAAFRGTAGRVTGEANIGTTLNPNESTVDPQLRGLVLAQKTGNTMSRSDQIKAEAAARAQGGVAQ
jgi:hypothetical protein